jgi:methyl-accepting chemotaxis protein
MKLSTKMIAGLCFILAVANIAVGIATVIVVRSSLRDAAEGKLVALVYARAAALDAYLAAIREDVALLALNETTAAAATEFNRAFVELGHTTVRRLYVDDNPHKHQLWDLVAASDGSAYSATHARYHPWFRAVAEARGYYDVFLISPDGDVTYSYTKEPDFGTNLATGPWRDSNLAKVWREVNTAKGRQAIAFSDFSAYAPIHGAAASFIAAPIMRGSQYLGAIAFQMPIGRLNALMHRMEGMGKSGETYVVGADHKMRTDSRFLSPGQTSIMVQDVATPSVDAALAGKTGVALIQDYRGIEVLSAYTAILFESVTWVVIGEIDAAEIFAAVNTTLRLIVGVSATALIVGFAVGFFGSHSIAQPLVGLTETMRRMAAGSYDLQIPATERTDEIGEMAKATDVFLGKLIEREALSDKVSAAAKDLSVEAKRRALAQQELLISNKKLQEVYRNRMTLLATLSHDMRTPIGAIMSYAELIFRQACGPVGNPRYQDFARTIHEAASGLVEQVSELLESARLQADDHPPIREDTAIEGLFSSLRELHALKAQQKGIALVVAKSDLTIKTDPRLLQRLLSNLAGNAIKFTPSGGTVELAARRRDNGTIALEVRDTGPGIPQNRIESMFRAFEQGASAESADGGVGLGLHIVKSLADKLGYRIETESEIGKGTTFRVICA